MDKWQVIKIVDFHDPKDTSTSFATREIYKITHLKPLPGLKTEVHGDRWDEALQRYRKTKPFVIGDGVPTAISIEFADDEREV